MIQNKKPRCLPDRSGSTISTRTATDDLHLLQCAAKTVELRDRVLSRLTRQFDALSGKNQAVSESFLHHFPQQVYTWQMSEPSQTPVL